ncbi:putative transcriptional regulator YdeE [Chitinophaga dinghuensis]|uniref:Putative transcriptional regulator YdeE n=1 Tax=Chitinophaga dinghuensis TaxID=1539050 RepID=A0A327W384_9BACT|nr:GyrI-like domain-containing protein [Chitinophaga dinghuensis]RAJ83252.1 putative transcriptional regulator YdeE [Chitinophaga dinghuensis]
MKIIGIAVRTTNQESKAAGDIGKLWEQFYSENLLDKIPNKVSNDIYSIYTDYVSDYTEDYTTILGVAVSSLESIPEGMVGRDFPEAHFREYLVEGEMPQAVVATWVDIWKHDKELKRKYTYDFELYQADAPVKIFIAI